MASTVPQLRYGDPTLWIVYPVGEYAIETAHGSERVILTMRTPDGFGVSFALNARDRRDLITAFEDSLLTVRPSLQ